MIDTALREALAELVARVEVEASYRGWGEWGAMTAARAALALQPEAQQQPVALPRTDSTLAAIAIEALLDEYGWPANTKNAARAGYEAAFRWIRAATPQPRAAEPAGQPPEGMTDLHWHALNYRTAQSPTLAQQAYDSLVECVGRIVAANLRPAAEPAQAASAAPTERCPYCDDTGDVHGLDGEWRGYCTCIAGKRLASANYVKAAALSAHPQAEPAPIEHGTTPIIDLVEFADGSVAHKDDLCMCKDRLKTDCPGEWEPGCDLGSNEKFARPATPDISAQIDAALSHPQAPAALPAVASHHDDIAVDRFAAAMKAKLARKRAEGRGGWNHRNDCTNEKLAVMLLEHIPKGDPVDIANFAMMIHQRDEQGIENKTIDNLPNGVSIISFVDGNRAAYATLNRGGDAAPTGDAPGLRVAAAALVDHLWGTAMQGMPFHLVADLRAALGPCFDPPSSPQQRSAEPQVTEAMLEAGGRVIANMVGSPYNDWRHFTDEAIRENGEAAVQEKHPTRSEPSAQTKEERQ